MGHKAGELDPLVNPQVRFLFFLRLFFNKQMRVF
jgi:hypothetical protein